MSSAKEALDAIRALPCGGPHEILGGETPIILAPHPDDEVLGCGALITAAARSGYRPVIVHVTDGSGSHPGSRAFPRDALIALRQREACLAAELLGVEPARVHFMGIRDTRAPREGPELTDAVNAIIERIEGYRRPVILAPWIDDPHGDHQSVSKMASHVSRIMTARHLSYIVWGWTLPDDKEITGGEMIGWRFPCIWDKQGKTRALRAYQSQISDLIDDDPDGFRLDDETLELMLSNDEAFLINA